MQYHFNMDALARTTPIRRGLFSHERESGVPTMRPLSGLQQTLVVLCLGLAMGALGTLSGPAHGKVLQGSVETSVSEPPPAASPDASPGIVGLDMVIRPASFPLVREVFPNTPAYQMGIRPGDRILAVDGTNVYGRSAWDVDQRISNVPGDWVTLTVQRQTAVRNVRLRVAALHSLPATIRAQFLTSLY